MQKQKTQYPTITVIKSSAGFTFIEMMAVLGIFAVISTLVIINFKSFNERRILEGQADIIASIIREAKTKTVSGKGGYQYGVHIASTSVTLFRSAVYDPATTTNVVTNLHSIVQIGTTTLNGGGNDIVFSKIKGTTAQHGTTSVNLISSQAEYKDILIKQGGIVEVR